MLKIVVDAQLPIVALRTRDTLNLPEVIKELTGRKPVPFELVMQSKVLDKNALYYYVCPHKSSGPPLEGLYQKLVSKESTLLIINPERVDMIMFDAGELPVPKKLVQELMESATGSAPHASQLMQALGGVTIKEAAELAKLTMARDASLTSTGVVSTRRQFFREQSGLTLVDTEQTYYRPSQQLESWITREKIFFREEPDLRLVPRGLLLDGPAGVGKSAGAKYLAEKLEVPLYRLDVGATKSKWVGESEGNLLANLTRLDYEEPAVVLFDEVEKIFSSNHSDGSGTTSSMLSQLLWWLAEHKSRVLSVLTTNDASKLPKELYREGRIDETMLFQPLAMEDAIDFTKGLLKTFSLGWEDKTIKALVKMAISEYNGATVSHAALTKVVYTAIKAASALKS